MSEKRTEITPGLEKALAPYWNAADPLIGRIQEDIHSRGMFPMQISLEQVAFHGWLCRLIGARRVLEVGTYLGLSAAGFAQAMGPGGRVDTIEIEPDHADIAEAWFAEGGLAGQITVHRGPALEAVPALAGPYDLCFLDGEKADNVALLELCVDRTRAGGLVLVDNAFQGGQVGEPGDDTAALATIAAMDWARSSDRVDAVVLPVADGILACRVLR